MASSAPQLIAPGPVVLAACQQVDAVILQFLNSRASAKSYGEYSSTLEALSLFNLVIRHVEGVLALARSDLALLPGAFACARAALETAAKATWMVNANSAFVRETRWLAHIQEEERVYERCVKRYSELGNTPQTFVSRAAELKAFRLAVEARLPTDVPKLKHNPTVDEMPESLNGKQVYPLYIYLSQYVHGGHAATWLYRQGVGSEAQPGEYVEPRQWYMPMRVCWLCLSELGSVLLWRLGRRSKSFVPESMARATSTTIEQIDSLHSLRRKRGDA